jgi:hypothetical protein
VNQRRRQDFRHYRWRPAFVAQVLLAPKRRSAIPIDDDIIIAAPVWHDWAKTMVFQWNEDGTEFTALDIGGNGKTTITVCKALRRPGATISQAWPKPWPVNYLQHL